MSQAEHDRRVDYIEFPSTDIEGTKRFYTNVFGWEFTDYGPSYTAFADGRLTGGFAATEEARPRGALVVLYSTNLEGIKSQVSENGGRSSERSSSFRGVDAFTSPIRAEMSWRFGQTDEFRPERFGQRTARRVKRPRPGRAILLRS